MENMLEDVCYKIEEKILGSAWISYLMDFLDITNNICALNDLSFVNFLYFCYIINVWMYTFD
jgi:hypothetical protein